MQDVPWPRSTRSGGFQPPSRDQMEDGRDARPLSHQNRNDLFLLVFLQLVADADLRKPVTQRIARKSQHARGLTFVSVSAAQSFSDHFVFPLFESHTFGKKTSWKIRALISSRINMNIAGLQQGPCS